MDIVADDGRLSMLVEENSSAVEPRPFMIVTKGRVPDENNDDKMCRSIHVLKRSFEKGY